ncbi:MAG: hypothetical protein IJD93_01445 [Ruminococcus sp.]|nr:hypothetical protein [Ruminococcus sp.]
MKKIISFVLVLVLLLGVCATVGAAETDTELQQKFYNYCLEVLPEDMKPSEDDLVKITFAKEMDYGTLFAADCLWIESEKTPVYKTIGNFFIQSDYTNYPYDLGIYVCSSTDEIYTLEDAHNEGIIPDLSVIKNISENYSTVKLGEDDKYAQAVLSKFFEEYTYGFEWNLNYYEGYEYYASDNLNQSTPDYVIISLNTNFYYDMGVTRFYGNYVMIDDNGMIPFYFGKCVYIPAENKLLSLDEAYAINLEGFEKAFAEGNLGKLMGDMDKDRKLTIRDATYIQKCIAGLMAFPKGDIVGGVGLDSAVVYISDFNRDCQRNIKDATAIQKYIAGLEY